MALFTLTDIQFKSQNRQSTAPQNLISNKYKTNTLRYPLDLGELDKGHYMVFHINEQVRTQFKYHLLLSKKQMQMSEKRSVELVNF